MTPLGRLPRRAVGEPLPPPARVNDPRHRCPLCGYRFAVGIEVCGRCGLSGGCEAVGCPHCGYRFPVESRTLAWLKRAWHRVWHRRRAIHDAGDR